MLTGDSNDWSQVLNRLADELHLTSFSAEYLLGTALNEDWERERSFLDESGNSRFSFEGNEEEVRVKLRELAQNGYLEEEDDDDSYDDDYDADWDYGGGRGYYDEY